MNTLALSATILLFNKLTDHSKNELKKYDLALERLQWARDKWNQDRSKCIDFDNRRQRKKNKEIKLFHLSLSYQIFTIYRKTREVMNYYFFMVNRGLSTYAPYNFLK